MALNNKNNKKGKPNNGSRNFWFVLVLFAMVCSAFYTIVKIEPSTSPCDKENEDITWKNTAAYDHGGGALEGFTGDLRDMEGAWNKLCFGKIANEKLSVGVFSKKWPTGSVPGGMERHAYTLYRALAQRGHDVHVYTASSDGKVRPDVVEGNLKVHFVVNAFGRLDAQKAWAMSKNRSRRFDVIHSESVALPHYRAKEGKNVVVTWHGIAYEALHSELFQELIRNTTDPMPQATAKEMADRLPRLVEEIRFFQHYTHHVPISDYAGDVLRDVYMIHQKNVHTILNGVDSANYRPDATLGRAFRHRHGVPDNASLVMGVAGRLVKDKGHPILFEALSSLLKDGKYSRIFLVVAGSGPWADRYRDLAPNVKVVGSLKPSELADFYNAIDIFVNPTLRPQGLDLTLLEAMHCGKPLLATRFPSITHSVIVSPSLGYTFSPSVESLIFALREVMRDGVVELQRKGAACRMYAQRMFTSDKMASDYERLFLCVKNESYCSYPLPTDCSQPPPFALS